jgi:HSP20 family protein
MKKTDFNINLERNVLSISSEMKNETKDEGRDFTRQEFSYQSFQRAFTLPESVDQEKVEAKYVDGVLKITLNKKEEMVAKNKEIKIS